MMGVIRGLGFDTVELGHDLRADLVPGVRQALADGTVRVASVHNFCPVPLGFKRVGPDLYSPCSTDRQEREAAVRHTRRTIEFAAEVGAEWVVLHGGRVEMSGITADLVHRALRGESAGVASYDKLRMRQMLDREKQVPPYLDALNRSLETLLPVAETLGCRLAIEVQPTWESVPTEREVFELLTQWDTPRLRYWHDLGHGAVRENLGFINHLRWLERLEPFLAGMHVHDVAPPARDHLAPGQGVLDFSRFAEVAGRTPLWVMEPHPRITAAELTDGVRCLKTAWQQELP